MIDGFDFQSSVEHFMNDRDSYSKEELYDAYLEMTEDYGTNICLSLSMGTDAPDEDEDEEDEEIAESVVFAKKGYYDEFLLD